MKKKGKKGTGSGEKMSSQEYNHPNDQTTAAGNSSNLGEPNLQPGSHQTPEKAIAVPRLPNSRKPNWNQPPKSTTFQDLTQSYHSDQGMIPKNKFKGIQSNLLQVILERNNMNQTERQILLTNIIGMSVSSSQDLNNQTRSQAQGDDDEEIKSSRFEDEESPQQQIPSLNSQGSLSKTNTPINKIIEIEEAKEQAQEVEAQPLNEFQVFNPEAKDTLSQLSIINREDSQAQLFKTLIQFSDSNQGSATLLHNNAETIQLISALINNINSDDQLERPTSSAQMQAPYQQQAGVHQSMRHEQLMQAIQDSEILKKSQSLANIPNPQILLDNQELNDKDQFNQNDQQLGEQEFNLQVRDEPEQILFKEIEEKSNLSCQQDEETSFQHQQEKNVAISHHSLKFVHSEKEQQSSLEIQSKSDTEEYLEDNNGDDADEEQDEDVDYEKMSKKSPSPPLGSKAERHHLDSNEDNRSEMIGKSQKKKTFIESVQDINKSQSSQMILKTNSFLKHSTDQIVMQTLGSQESKQSILGKKLSSNIELQENKIIDTQIKEKSVEGMQKSQQFQCSDEDEDLEQIEECVEVSPNKNMNSLQFEQTLTSPTAKKPFFQHVFGLDKKANRYERQETGQFASSANFNNEVEMAEVFQLSTDQFMLQKKLDEEKKNMLAELQQNNSSKSAFVQPPQHQSNKTRSTIGGGLIGTNKVDYTEMLSAYNLNLQTIKSKKLKKKRCQPIQPDSNFKTSWDLMGLFLILYEALVIPYRVTFNMLSSGFLMLFEIYIDTFFIIDVFINLYTGYYKKGSLVMKRRHVMCRYLKTWFIIDLLASIPFAWFISDNDLYNDDGELMRSDALVHHTSQLLRLLKIVRFMRIIRMIRLFKLRGLVNRFEEVFFNDSVSTFMSLLKVFFVIFYLVHWAACIFFYISEIERFEGRKNWITKFGIDKLEPFDQYIASAHWALTTMTTVGYGDVVPMSVNEVYFAIFSEILACGVFAYIIGSLSTIVDHQAEMLVEFADKILQINDFMIFNKLPTDFRIKVRYYMNYVYDNKKKYKLDEEDVLLMLNENLRVETTVHLNGKLLNETPLFKSFEVAFLSQLTFVIKKRIFLIDEHIFNEGDKGESLYYIQKGNVVLMHKKTQTFIKELTGDDFMGECAFFSGEPRSASARSKNFTDVITLYKHDFIQTTDEFPKAFQMLLDIQNTIKTKRDFSKIGVKCYFCDKLGHISIDCPNFYTQKGNTNRVYTSNEGKLLVRKSKDGFGHKMPKVTSDYNQVKQFKEDFPFQVHHFDDYDGVSSNNHMIDMYNNNTSLKPQTVYGNMLIHEIEEQSDEHKVDVASSSGYSEENEGDSLKQNQELIVSEKKPKQAVQTWNQHTMNLKEHLELKSYIQNIKGQQNFDRQQSSIRLRSNSNLINKQENETTKQQEPKRINNTPIDTPSQHHQRRFSKLETQSNMTPTRASQIRRSIPNEVVQIK